MSAALQVYYRAFDDDFYQLPLNIRDRIEAKIDNMGADLARFPHHRMVGSDRYRLRVGDYRIIYRFDLNAQSLHLLAVGHRREIYRH